MILDDLRAPIAFAVSLIVGIIGIPLISRLAVTVGAVDRPGGRRGHLSDVPRLGGVAVVAAAALASLVVALVSGVRPNQFATTQVQAMLGGALLVFLIGLADDIKGVPPRGKLIVQLIAALVVVQTGGMPESIILAKGGAPIYLGAIAPMLSVLWIVGVTNAFNLIDGLDGLAVICAIVAVGTMALSGVYLGEPSRFIFVAALLGGLLAFLRHNWHPAKVFLGDAGSMTIGFLLATRSISSATDGQGHLHVLVPIAALSYPVLDTFVAIARRWLRGHSFSKADGRHIHHQLVTIGLSVPRAVSVLGTVAFVVAGTGLAVSFAPPHLTLSIVISAIVAANFGLLYAIWRLGYTEFIALGKSVYSGLVSSRRVVRERIRIIDIAREIKHAKSEAEVHDLVRTLVDFEHIRKAELVESTTSRTDVAADVVGVLDYPSTIRFECPVHRAATGQVLQLRVWSTSAGVAHHSIQRLESIIAPELERWYLRHDEQVVRQPGVEDPSVRSRRGAGV
jgi:UDP-GlcNAc:undecaprenyl-phosphate GlcNAc-1-phosphate transferase